MQLDGKRSAILATNGFEQSELEVPRDKLRAAGAKVEIVSLASGEGWEKKDWGRPVKVDRTLDEVSPFDYDAVVLPGGQINPDLLRVEPPPAYYLIGRLKSERVALELLRINRRQRDVRLGIGECTSIVLAAKRTLA